MSIDILPIGQSPEALYFPHFPDRLSAFIFRNWNMVPLKKMASILSASEKQIFQIAMSMGLPEYCDAKTEEWKTSGYITLLRQNWHLLPYEQILELLEIDAAELEYRLKEDDGLWRKLGNLKPRVPVLTYSEPDEKTTFALRCIKMLISKYTTGCTPKFEPFEFEACTNVASPVTDRLRLAYSYSASYGDPLLKDDLNDYPEKVLKEYQDAGINALWLQGLLYKLVPWSRAPRMSFGSEKRMFNLQRLSERARKYGIGIYLYFNEPRSLTGDYKTEFDDLKGCELEDGRFNLCTSRKEVLDYLKFALHTVFKKCPELAGMFMITTSENWTNCHSRTFSMEKCPLCSGRTTDEIMGELIASMAEGVHSANPEAHIMAYTWGWESDYAAKLIERLPKYVSILSVSEWGMETECGGVKSFVKDYSISKPGPSKQAAQDWQIAEKFGHRKVAKIQLNNSWEMSAVPYIPVFDLIEEHLDNLRRFGIEDFMLCWTHGGMPSPMTGLLSKRKETLLMELYGRATVDEIAKGISVLSDAFRGFPFDRTAVIYNAPLQVGPSNLLWLTPSGYESTMVGIPYDDIEHWRGVFPETVFLKAFRTMADGWLEGLKVIKKAKEKILNEHRKNYDELVQYAEAVWCHFQSTANQVEFIMLRQEWKNNHRRIAELLQNEILLCEKLCLLQCRDARIGFEPSNHYYYTPNLLLEKILNCCYILNKIKE